MRAAQARKCGFLLSTVCSARQQAMCYEGRKRLYAGGRQSSIAVVVSIVKVPGRGSLLSRQRKDVNRLCRNATAHVTCSGGCTSYRGAFAIVNKGSSGSCRIFQIVGSAIVIFVKLVERELRRRGDDYSCSSKGKISSVRAWTNCRLRHVGLARDEER